MKNKAILLAALIFSALVLSMTLSSASAQEQKNYYVTVQPSTTDRLQYLSVGKNATLSFEANWTYAPNSVSLIANATATIEVTNQKGDLVDTLNVNTTTGFFSFRYLMNSPEILVFTPTKLVTSNGEEWNDSNLVTSDLAKGAFGLQSFSSQVYWDTFAVSIVGSDTNTAGKTTETVNVTYLLIPEDGLLVGSVRMPKIASGVNVTINGIQAQEIQPGIYEASSSTWLPTAYVNVKVSEVSWATKAVGFNLIQNANQPIWTYGIGLMAALISAALVMRFLLSKRAHSQLTVKHPNFPFFGAVTLIVSSVISLYWGIVGIEGVLHTFEWLSLAILGLLAFGIGLIGSLTLSRSRFIPIAITATIMPMIVNVIAVKASMDAYQLANPWLFLFGSLFLSIISGFFICNIEDSPLKPVINK